MLASVLQHLKLRKERNTQTFVPSHVKFTCNGHWSLQDYTVHLRGYLWPNRLLRQLLRLINVYCERRVTAPELEVERYILFWCKRITLTICYL